MKTDEEIRWFFNDTLERLGWTVDMDTVERFIWWMHNNEKETNPCPLYNNCIGDKCWLWVKTLEGMNGHPDEGMCGVKKMNDALVDLQTRQKKIERMLSELTK